MLPSKMCYAFLVCATMIGLVAILSLPAIAEEMSQEEMWKA